MAVGCHARLENGMPRNRSGSTPISAADGKSRKAGGFPNAGIGCFVELHVKDTKLIGDISAAMVLAALLKSGKSVLLPFGERHPYDLVVETDGVFTKVQCKTGRLKGDSIRFALCSVVRNAQTKKWHRKSYGDRVDVYGVYSPELEKCYLVPAKLIEAKVEGALSLKRPRRHKHLLAQNFEI